MNNRNADQRIIRLTREERIFLLQMTGLPPGLRDQLDRDTTRSTNVWVSLDEAVDVRERLQDRLLETGFDRDYEPTKEGRMLESLIDRFFTG